MFAIAQQWGLADHVRAIVLTQHIIKVWVEKVMRVFNLNVLVKYFHI